MEAASSLYETEERSVSERSMDSKIDKLATKRPRADVLRNRELILSAAREVFTEAGADATLEDVVKRSGLGVGTLYRHFPTRDALVSAVYLAEVEKVAQAGRELGESLPPMEALRSWLYLFIDYLGTKRAMKELVDSLVCEPGGLQATSGKLIQESIDFLVGQAVQSGGIVMGNLEPLDLLRAVYGVASTGADLNWRANARGMADVVLAGLTTVPD
jgi:AcrR family transcriptional regulator